MKKKMSPALNWRGLFRFLKMVIIISIVGAAVGYMLFYTDWFILNDYRVAANEDRKEWIEQNFNTYFAGKNTFLISLQEGADALRKEPSVRQVKLKRQLPGGIFYEIQYRQPIAAVQQSNLYLLLDEEGYLISTSQEAPEGMPRITELSLDRFVIGKPIETDKTKELQLALKLLRLLEKAQLKENSVIALKEGGLQVQVSNGLEGKFSIRNSTETSFNHFMDIYNDLNKKGVTAGLIDVSTDGYPAFRPFGE